MTASPEALLAIAKALKTQLTAVDELINFLKEESEKAQLTEVVLGDVKEIVAEQIMSTKEAARYLGFAPQTLHDWRCKGNGPLFLKMGGNIKYRRTDLDKWMKDKVRKSTSDTGN